MKTHKNEASRGGSREEAENRIAVHESGHLVLAFSLGWQIDGVGFELERGGISARSLIEGPAFTLRKTAVAGVMIAMSGAAAEEALIGNCDMNRMKGDAEAGQKAARALLRGRRSKKLDPAQRDPKNRDFFSRARNVSGVLSAGFLAAYRTVQIWRPAVTALVKVFQEAFLGDDWEEMRMDGKTIEGVIRSAMSATPKGRRALGSVKANRRRD